MLFRLAGVDNALAAQSIPQIPELMEEAVRSRAFDLPRIGNVLRALKHPGEWRANLTKVTREGSSLSGTNVDDLTYSRNRGATPSTTILGVSAGQGTRLQHS